MTTNAPAQATAGDGKWILLCLLAYALGNGCQKYETPDPAKKLVGKAVTVQFRRDALGGRRIHSGVPLHQQHQWCGNQLHRQGGTGGRKLAGCSIWWKTDLGATGSDFGC